MILLHEAVQVVHEPLPGVFSVLEVNPEVDRFYRADLLAHPAEDAPELVDLVDNGIPVPLVVFSPHEADAIGGTDGGAKAAGHTLRPSIGMDIHAMSSPPTGREGRSFLRVLEGDLIGINKMLEGQGHSLEGGTKIRRPGSLRASHDLDSWWHLNLGFLEFNLRRCP